MKRTKLETLGILGVVSLLSYTAMVTISPFFYPGYNAMTMAVSELTAEGAPSKAMADQLNALFGPCGLVSITAFWASVGKDKPKLFRIGIALFMAMEWVCSVGYSLFPLISGESSMYFQNIMHMVVTVAVVVLSLLSLIILSFSSEKAGLKSLGVWAMVALIAMVLGPIGTSFLPSSVFGLFERFSTFSAVVFNAVLGVYLFNGKLRKA